ncbi:MAG: hypothetical protein ACO34J_07840 [Prochlorothrix sp.]
MVNFGLHRVLFTALALGSLLGGQAPALAQTDPIPTDPDQEGLAQPTHTALVRPAPDLSPLNLNVLQDPNREPVRCFGTAEQLDPDLILTPDTICQQGLTPPSLWWMQEQFEAQSPAYKKLVTTWLTYLPNVDRPGRVDLVVNLQRWSVMDYFSRYEFIHAFGGEASRSGYNTRIFNLRGEFLGSYTCSQGDQVPLLQPVEGAIEFDRSPDSNSDSSPNLETAGDTTSETSPSLEDLEGINPAYCHIVINRVGRILHDIE